MPATEGGAWPLRRRPDYRGDWFLEFYGIETGRYRAYLDGLSGPSAATVVDIGERGIAVAEFAPEATRLYELTPLRGGLPLRERATLALSYRDGFGLLLPWHGDPDGRCTVPATFGSPETVAVRIHAEGSRVIMGAAATPRAVGCRLLLDLEIGARRLLCQRTDAGDAGLCFRLAWSGPMVGFRLCCLRPSEVRYPPCAHTVASGPEDATLVIESVASGDHLVGVGGRGVGTSTLWRVVHVGAEDCLVTLARASCHAAPVDRGYVRPWSPRLPPLPGEAVVVAINRSTDSTVEVHLGTSIPRVVRAGEMRAFAVRAPALARAAVSRGATTLEDCAACLEPGDLLTVEYD